MKIGVCIKQIPLPTHVALDKKTGKVVAEGAPLILNPPDKVAVEAALRLKNTYGGKVVALTLGRSSAEDALKEALAMGVDTGYLLSDSLFEELDGLSTAYVLTQSIKMLGDFNLLLFGQRGLDDQERMIGPFTAELLGWPTVTDVARIDSDGEVLLVEEEFEDFYRMIRVPMPTVLTLTSDAYEPRFPTSWGIHEAYHVKEIHMVKAEDLDIDRTLLASRTRIRQLSLSEERARGREMIGGSPRDMARELTRRVMKLVGG